jgi:uncharacterized protein (TIGR03067 family)
MKTFAFALLAGLSLAFAPAPFPRAVKPEREDDLKKLQGAWVRDGDKCLIQVTGQRVQFPSKSDAWVIRLDAKTTPRRIDFVHHQDKKNIFLGIYRIEGDTLTYCVRHSADEKTRPKEFASKDGAWLQVYRRQKP